MPKLRAIKEQVSELRQEIQSKFMIVEDGEDEEEAEGILVARDVDEYLAEIADIE